MTYEYDIFVSYRRSPTVGQWVRNHLIPRLKARLAEVAPTETRIYFDGQVEDGANWPAELKHQVRNSSLLLTVWSADYFRSPWCMAEWKSFREREMQLGMFSDEVPQGLVYPVRYADGDHFHPDAKAAQCTKDFSSLNYPDDVFKSSVKYLEFDDLVKVMASDLVKRLRDVPAWSASFPIVEPPAMRPVSLARPVI